MKRLIRPRPSARVSRSPPPRGHGRRARPHGARRPYTCARPRQDAPPVGQLAEKLPSARLPVTPGPRPTQNQTPPRSDVTGERRTAAADTTHPPPVGPAHRSARQTRQAVPRVKPTDGRKGRNQGEGQTMTGVATPPPGRPDPAPGHPHAPSRTGAGGDGRGRVNGHRSLGRVALSGPRGFMASSEVDGVRRRNPWSRPHRTDEIRPTFTPSGGLGAVPPTRPYGRRHAPTTSATSAAPAARRLLRPASEDRT